MSHGLEGAKDMVYVGQTPWHSLGEKVDSITCIPAILDWLLVTMAMWLHGHSEQRKVDGHVCLIRNTDGKQIGVVGSDYKPHQNREIWNNLVLPYIDAARLVVDTAGMLHGGRIIWFLCKVPGMRYDAGNGDVTEMYVLIATSHDGSMRTQVLATGTRVVCMNTLRVAISTATKGFRQKHTSELKVDEAQAFINAAIDGFKYQGEAAAKMKATKVNSSVVRSFMAELAQPELITLTLPNRGDKYAGKTIQQILDFTADDRALEMAIRNDGRRVLKTLLDSVPTQVGGFDGTVYGMVNAVSSWTDHERGRNADNRMASAWFGPSADLKDDAFKLGIKYADLIAA